MDIVASLPTLLSYQNKSIYFLKCFRVFYFSTMLGIQKSLTYKFAEFSALNRQTFLKIEFFSSFSITLIFMVHLLACLWILIGYSLEFSWLHYTGYIDKPRADIYVTSLYWVITTLTTVGYGDVKGVVY